MKRFTTKDAARELGISRVALYKTIRQGRIVAPPQTPFGRSRPSALNPSDVPSEVTQTPNFALRADQLAQTLQHTP